MNEDDIKTGSLKAWFLAARPKTLTGAAVPVIIGLALAWDAWSHPEANVSALEVLRKAVADNDSLFSDGTRVTLSIGYYNVKEAQMTSEEIFYRADQALYQAKYNGKNQVYPVY